MFTCLTWFMPSLYACHRHVLYIWTLILETCYMPDLIYAVVICRTLPCAILRDIDSMPSIYACHWLLLNVICIDWLIFVTDDMYLYIYVHWHSWLYIYMCLIAWYSWMIYLINNCLLFSQYFILFNIAPISKECFARSIDSLKWSLGLPYSSQPIPVAVYAQYGTE